MSYAPPSFLLLLPILGPSAALEGPDSQSMIGGEPVDNFRHPYNSVVYVNSGLQCTGALIRPLLVQTAAHCVEEGAAAETNIEFGLVDGDTRRYERQSGVDRIVVHPRYKCVHDEGEYTRHGIAPVRLKEEMNQAVAVAYSIHCVVYPKRRQSGTGSRMGRTGRRE